ncbi:MAG: hypothetical protein NW215_02560 [Hyphomicrobiales bacterium]|nr:hypothetical protein [Hyphomicrobiales bacterium]
MRRAALWIAGGLLAVILSGPATATMLVEESTAPAHRVGSKLDDNAALSVPQGAILRLFIMQSGDTHVVRGPHQGTLAEYRKKRSVWWRRVFGKFLSDDESASQAEGGVRSLRP